MTLEHRVPPPASHGCVVTGAAPHGLGDRSTTLPDVSSMSADPTDWREKGNGPPWSIPPNCFLHRQEHLGAPGGRRRWRQRGGQRLYEWDPVHGEIEAYNARGRHVGVLHAITGVMVGEAVPGRRIDV